MAATDFINRFLSRPMDAARSRARAARIARLLDFAFTIPGTRVRIGLDPVLGLVPGAGDVVTTLLSLYVIYEAYRAGLPRSALLRMGTNVALDALISAVPLLGDIGDVFWRANRRNLAIFDEHLARMPSGPVIEGDWRRIDR